MRFWRQNLDVAMTVRMTCTRYLKHVIASCETRRKRYLKHDETRFDVMQRSMKQNVTFSLAQYRVNVHTIEYGLTFMQRLIKYTF